jgi:adenylyltransferase/sulfurtransferase
MEEKKKLFQRYSRQLILPEIGIDGQIKLCQSKVLLVGVGGIGSTVAMYLVGAGVPIDIVDFDNVEESNLHRYLKIGSF